MQEYLLAALISTEAKPESVQKQIAKLIGEFEGKVFEQENREQALAYPIKKHTSAILLKTFFSFDPVKVLKLTKDLDHEAEILRFLLVKFPFTKDRSDNAAKVARIKNQTTTVADESKTAIIDKKVVKKTKPPVKKASEKKIEKEQLDKALAKILKE
jgi:ribosomal protein S6